MYIIIAQAIGVIAMTCAVISFQQRTHKGILTFQLIGNIFFTIHFFMLGAITGAILNLIAMVRAAIFVNKGKKWAESILWFWFFCVASCVVGILSWEGYRSLLPIGGMICTTVAYWIKAPKIVRRVALPSSLMWIVYNGINGSFPGVITEVISIASIFIAMIRLDFKKENKVGAEE